MDPTTAELLKSFAGFPSILIIVPAVQALKKSIPTWPGWAWPLCALALGMLLNVLVGVALRSDPYVNIALGVGLGFLAMIAYDKSNP
jgi:high-affinity Fe2+/Pb2+ permease